MASNTWKSAAWASVLLCCAGLIARAEAAPDAMAIFQSMHPETGTVLIANGMAKLNVGPQFRYLDTADATTYLTKIQGNPESAVTGIEGVIYPTVAGETWFAVLAYSSEGHVLDSDEKSINYDDLLKQIQSQADDQAKRQRDAGFAGLRIVGWAQRPFYDPVTKKLYWAKAIQFDNQPGQTLNYDVRILGRTGFVNLKIVDSVDHLTTINAHMPEILSMVNFTPGNTYADYVAGTDHLAAYGIAGLIAGGVLAKVGFFKGLLVLAAAFWKVIAAFFVGAFAMVGRFFRNLFARKPAQ
jgi:uncharacterized membrane-anchored protein